MHSGEKPYHCDFCDKAFSDPTAKMRHLEIHDMEKGNKCPHCEKRFNQVMAQFKETKRFEGGTMLESGRENINLIMKTVVDELHLKLYFECFQGLKKTTCSLLGFILLYHRRATMSGLLYILYILLCPCTNSAQKKNITTIIYTD